jgi:L-alanine-DL-glutamate epimerase-like enolase superfamily enzyme
MPVDPFKLTEAEVEVLRAKAKRNSVYLKWAFARVEISADDLARWDAVAARLGEDVAAALAQVRRHRMKSSVADMARVCRHVANISEEPLKTEAVALAEELEARAV